MKRMMIPLLAAVLCAGCMLASFGALSDDRRQPGQNAFGGFGQIHSTGNPANRFYYDDTAFYYPVSDVSWDAYSTLTRTVYAYDFASGQSSAVCKRISCTHETAACALHPLYQSGDPKGCWNLIDSAFIAPHRTKSSLQIIRWEPLTDCTEVILELPPYLTLSDSEGLTGRYESFFNEALRLTDDRILIGWNNEMHVFDSDMHDLFSFPGSGLTYPLIAGRRLFWLGLSGDLRCVHLDTGKTETGILTGLPVSGITEAGFPDSAFAYGNELFFAQGGTVYALDADTFALRTVTATDPPDAENPYALFGTENRMYYRSNGTVCCIDIDTGAVTALPDMEKVPCAAVREYLLYLDPEPDGTDDITVFDRSGRAVLQ